jgi:outer membrane protein OmpA-like peptidoglycan-associated protein
MARRKSARHPARRRGHGRGGGQLLWIGLIALSIVAFAGIGYAAWSIGQRPGHDAATNCPDGGPRGAIAILIDGSSPLSRAQEGRLRHEIGRVIDEAPTGTMVSLGLVSDSEAERGARLALCKPLGAHEVGTVTANPKLVGDRYERTFAEPVTREIAALLGLGQGGETARLRQARDLAASLSGSGAAIVDTGSELVVTLPEAITFETGSAALRPGLEPHLEAIARSLAEHPQTTVQVVGHTDNVGGLELNRELSERRAAAVAEVLVRSGADGGRIRTLGRAYLEPTATNDSEAGRRANRRVELILATRSPIMESLQALIAETPLLVEDRSRGGDQRERRLLIVSDMLQNSEAVSFYRGQEWADFQASRDFVRLGRNLHDVEVEILRLPRDEPAIRDRNAVEHFWVRYFDYQGAGVRARTIGDL